MGPGAPSAGALPDAGAAGRGQPQHGRTQPGGCGCPPSAPGGALPSAVFPPAAGQDPPGPSTQPWFAQPCTPTTQLDKCIPCRRRAVCPGLGRAAPVLQRRPAAGAAAGRSPRSCGVRAQVRLRAPSLKNEGRRGGLAGAVFEEGMGSARAKALKTCLQPLLQTRDGEVD